MLRRHAATTAMIFENLVIRIFLTWGTFINDVPRFLAIFDLPTYLVLLYNVPFLGLSWTPLPALIWDVINERSLIGIRKLKAHICQVCNTSLKNKK